MGQQKTPIEAVSVDKVDLVNACPCAFVVAVHVFEIIDPILEPTPTIVPWRVHVAEPEQDYPPSKFVPKNARVFRLRYRHQHK